MSEPLSQASPALTLYSVMSPWHPQDAEQGTFEETVWAASPEEAERELACRMACSSSGCSEGESTDGWIEDHLASCQHLMVTIPVVPRLQSTLIALLSGPEGNFDGTADADLQAIMAILKKRGLA